MIIEQFPMTRFQGSKRKLLSELSRIFTKLSFTKVLDAFGGSGSVSFLLKGLQKEVVFNDQLQFCEVTGRALIENQGTHLSDEDIHWILTNDDKEYDNVIFRNFQGIYYLDEENEWLDRVVQNIMCLCNYAQDLAYFALFQACIAKRPYNLFHRANLNMRTSQVERSFGNKTTWDKPFDEHFIEKIKEANVAVFQSSTPCKAIRNDILSLSNSDYDLVYLDPPYVSHKGIGVNYRDYYHFLEGMLDYNNWESMIDRRYKHLGLMRTKNPWNDKTKNLQALEQVITTFQDAIIVLSYRHPGIPSKTEIADLLKKYKQDVKIIEIKHQYALSRHKGKEIVYVAK